MVWRDPRCTVHAASFFVGEWPQYIPLLYLLRYEGDIASDSDECDRYFR